jgi:hypothetical protein
MKGERPDVSHWLIEAYVKNGSQQAERPWLSGDATALVVAGRLAYQTIRHHTVASLTRMKYLVEPSLQFSLSPSTSSFRTPHSRINCSRRFKT